MSTRLAVACALVLAAGGGCTVRLARPTPEAEPKHLRITIVDPGDGVASLARSSRGDTLLVDGGGVGGYGVLRAVLGRLGALPPDHVAVTHHDGAHVGGLLFLLGGRDGLAGTPDDVKVPGTLLGPGPDYRCSALECRAWAILAASQAVAARVGDTFDLGQGTRARVVEVRGSVVRGAPAEGPPSLSLVLERGAFRMLFAGLLPDGAAAARLVAAVGPVDVALVSADDAGTLAEAGVDPRAKTIVVTPTGRIPCAPSSEQLAVLAARGARVLLADAPGKGCPGVPSGVETAHGLVEVTTDGTTFEVVPGGFDAPKTAASGAVAAPRRAAVEERHLGSRAPSPSRSASGHPTPGPGA